MLLAFTEMATVTPGAEHTYIHARRYCLSYACTGKQFAHVLQLFHNSGWQNLHLPQELRTVRDWHLAVRRSVDKHEQFEHIDVAAACGIKHECLILSIRRDLPGTFLRMIKRSRLSAILGCQGVGRGW